MAPGTRAGGTRRRARYPSTTSCTVRCISSRGSPRACGRSSERPLPTDQAGSGPHCLGSLRWPFSAGASRTRLPAAFWSALVILVSFWLLTAISFDAGARAARAEIPVRRRRAASSRTRKCPGRDPGTRFGGPGSRGGCVPRHDRQPRGPRQSVPADLRPQRPRSAARWRLFRSAAPAPIPTSLSSRTNTDIVSLDSLQVGPYLSAVDAFGSPAYGASALAGAGGGPRAPPTSCSPTRRLPTGARSTSRPRPAARRPRVRAGRRGAAPAGKLPHASAAPAVPPPRSTLPRPGVTVTVPRVPQRPLSCGASRPPSRFDFQLRGTGAC